MGKCPSQKSSTKRRITPSSPRTLEKKKGKAEQKGDSARQALPLKSNKVEGVSRQNRIEKCSNVTRKIELPTKSDAPDEDDESVTVSVDNVDMEEVEDKNKSKKKEKAGPKKMLSLGQPSKLVGDAYSELAHDYHNVFEREGRHHKGISTLCCQCVCYIIFLALYLLTVFSPTSRPKAIFSSNTCKTFLTCTADRLCKTVEVAKS